MAGEILKALTNGGAKIGDFVVVRYNDTNKLRRILLSETENDPEQGIVHVKQPLGTAILGQTLMTKSNFRKERKYGAPSSKELNGCKSFKTSV